MWLSQSYEDVEDLDEDVYCSIVVTKYIRVRMNPEHPKFLPFINFQLTSLHVNKVNPVVS